MNRDALIASLQLNTEHALYLDGDTEGRFFDWGNGADGKHNFEVCTPNASESIVVEMTRDEMRLLHAQLTLTLLSYEV